VKKGILPVKTITDTFNEGKSENIQITYQRMGRKLAALGFKKGKTGDGASAILWNEEKFMRILSSYGLGKTSEIPETSETLGRCSPNASDVSDHTGVSDVYSDAHGGKKSHNFVRTARNGVPGTVLRLWDVGRQRQAAAQMLEAAAIDLREGEL